MKKVLVGAAMLVALGACSAGTGTHTAPPSPGPYTTVAGEHVAACPASMQSKDSSHGGVCFYDNATGALLHVSAWTQ